jgi:hypothetical protein
MVRVTHGGWRDDHHGTSHRRLWSTGFRYPGDRCPSWCRDPGHVAEHAREDQNCYSATTSVVSSLDLVTVGEYGVGGSRIGAMAYLGFGKVPVVLVHVEEFENGLDEERRLTIDEARQLARDLLTAATSLSRGTIRPSSASYYSSTPLLESWDGVELHRRQPRTDL